MFDLSQNEEVVPEKDSLGAGEKLQSGIYDFTVDMAYLSEANDGAATFTLSLKTDSGAFHKETFYITTNKADGCKTFRVNKSSGKKATLPAHTIVRNIVAVTLNKELETAYKESQKKTLSIYDFSIGREIDKEIDNVFIDMVGKRVKLAIKVIKKNRNVKDQEGNWSKTNEVVENRKVANVFFPDTKLTVLERKNGATEPKFHNDWLDKWEGKVDDWYKEIDESSDSSDSSSAPTQEKMFGD